MNHIRGFFRPNPTTHVSGHPSVTRTNKSQGSSSSRGSGSASVERKTRSSPKPHNRRNETSNSKGEGAGGTAAATRHGSSTSSVTSGTALDHLYENFCDKISAGELKSQPGARKPCMVVREYNDEYIAPKASNMAVFLPPAYSFVDDDEGNDADDGLSGYGDVSDILTHTRVTTVSLKGDSAMNSVAGATSTSATTVFNGPISSSDVNHACAFESGRTAVARRPQPPPSPRNLLTTSKVIALSSEEDACESLSGTSKQREKKPARTGRIARQVTPPDVDKRGRVTATPELKHGMLKGKNHCSSRSSNHADESRSGLLVAEAQKSSEVRRYSMSSWSFLEDEAKIHGRVCRVVVPPAPGAAASGGGNSNGGDDGEAHRPSEVEVVRLNDALFTSAELAQWRRYQAARMNSFMGTSNEACTPSASTRSRDAPSSNSISGPEFMPVLGTVNMASESADRTWEDFDGDGDDAHMGVPVPRGRLIHVWCVDGAGGSSSHGNQERHKQSTLPSAASAGVTVATTSAELAAPPQRAVDTGATERFDDHRHRQSTSASQQRQQQQRSPSRDSISCSGSSGNSRSDEENDDGTVSDAASSATSNSGSRSPSANSLDADAVTTIMTTTTSESTQLPGIFSESHAQPNNKKGTRAHDSALVPYVEYQAGVAEKFQPLPSVTRPHGLPFFRRRVLH